jgi:hypothetical protein
MKTLPKDRADWTNGEWETYELGKKEGHAMGRKATLKEVLKEFYGCCMATNDMKEDIMNLHFRKWLEKECGKI